MSATLVQRDRNYARLKEYLIEHTGLAYYRDRDDELAWRIGQRLRALQIGGYGPYLALLAEPGGQAELDLLIAELTIGETYFFRHAEQFEALRKLALPDIVERNRDSKTLRVWSAGCSNGAEAYTLSILTHDEIPGTEAGWNVSIVGTDVSRRSLAQARLGRYESWALRGMSPEARERYLRLDQGSWVIQDRYRQGVAVQYHNLVRDVLPSRVNNLFAFDLILCRNVMIYFDRATVAALAERLWECLADGGWLAVGHADIDMEAFRAFRPCSRTASRCSARRRLGGGLRVAGEPRPADGGRAAVALARAAAREPSGSGGAGSAAGRAGRAGHVVRSPPGARACRSRSLGRGGRALLRAA